MSDVRRRIVRRRVKAARTASAVQAERTIETVVRDALTRHGASGFETTVRAAVERARLEEAGLEDERAMLLDEMYLFLHRRAFPMPGVE